MVDIVGVLVAGGDKMWKLSDTYEFQLNAGDDVLEFRLEIFHSSSKQKYMAKLYRHELARINIPFDNNGMEYADYLIIVGDSFADNIVSDANNPEELITEILNLLSKQGFNIDNI